MRSRVINAVLKDSWDACLYTEQGSQSASLYAMLCLKRTKHTSMHTLVINNVNTNTVPNVLAWSEEKRAKMRLLTEACLSVHLSVDDISWAA